MAVRRGVVPLWWPLEQAYEGMAHYHNYRGLPFIAPHCPVIVRGRKSRIHYPDSAHRQYPGISGSWKNEKGGICLRGREMTSHELMPPSLHEQNIIH